MGFRLPFFPMYAAETLADGRFQSWTCEERGAWITLLLANWNDGDIPSSQTALAKMLRLESGAMAAVWSAIGDRFIEVPGKPGRLWSTRLEEERDKATGLSRIRGEAGAKGANARWNKGNGDNGKGMRLPSVSHASANGKSPMAKCQRQPQPPSQPQEQEALAPPAGIKPLGVHLQAQCPKLCALVAAMSDAGVQVEVGHSAARWDEAEALLGSVGEDVALDACLEAATRRKGDGPTPLAYLLFPLRDRAAIPRIPRAKPVALPAPEPEWLASHPGAAERWAAVEQEARMVAYPEKLAEYLGNALQHFKAEMAGAP